MRIQWYPGHMTKALRMMETEIKNVDLVIYVLDSRAPFSCVNPSFSRVIGSKPIIYAFNKIDLADMTLVKYWENHFKTENSDTVILNSTMSGSAKQVADKMRSLLKPKLEKNKEKGIVMPLRALVLGVPNSGKSTLINNLSKKGKTITGNRPGVTKGKQWVRVDSGIELLDTPGTLWPSFDNEVVATHLAYIGSIRDQVIDTEGLAYNLLEDMKAIDPQILTERYGFDVRDMETLEIFDEICKKRGFLFKKNDYDYGRGAIAILDDFRKGRLGKFTLDTPEKIAEGEKHAEVNRREREQKEKEAKQKFGENYKKKKNKHGQRKKKK